MMDTPAVMPSDALGEYTRRREARQQRADRLERRYQRVTRAWKNVRLLIAGLIWEEINARLHGGVILTVLGLALLMVVLLGWANRITRAWRRAVRATAYYEHRLTVLAGQWAGRGERGQRYLDESDPSALDLDLFGDASLFELLCSARTRAGQDTLAAWLRDAASGEEVRGRQAGVTSLRDRIDLREDLELIAGEMPPREERSALAAWVAQPPWPGLGLARGFIGSLSAAVLLSALLGVVAGLSGWVVLLMLAVVGGAALALRHRVHATLAPIEPYARTLAGYADVLARWGREGFEPEARVEPLRRLTRRLSWLRVMPLAAPVLGQTQLALAVEAWRRHHGPRLAGWLDADGRAEALCSLAAYAYENPDDPFPEIVELGPWLEGQGLAHPLMPRGTCVPNDLVLGGERRLLVVSGSNMSGKSTLLRTVGVNAVLALAGAPVRAVRLKLCPLAVGATLRIQDSLQRGQSRFYAEITRLRQILDLAKGPVPVLFLLDELLSGTNSEDRRAGSEAVLRRLVESGAIGLVTTHDLALTAIADVLGPAGANVHFDEQLENGQLVFDYTMRPGVVRQRNALALMRSMGIEV